MEYNELFVKRLLSLKSIERKKNASTRSLFDKIKQDPELSALYAQMSEFDCVRTNNVTHGIETLIKIYGWRVLIENFVRLAKNKEYQHHKIGLDKSSKVWAKIAKLLASMPKETQL